MPGLLHELVLTSASRTPDAVALRARGHTMSYGELAESVAAFASGLLHLGIRRAERIAVFLPKQFETVCAMFGAAQAGAVFVPINPLLKPEQVGYILRDCNVRVLVTSPARLNELCTALRGSPDLHAIVIVGDARVADCESAQFELISWESILAAGAEPRAGHRVIDGDMVSILYTSGSTGKPKGVMLSHRNMVAGAISVASYLDNVPEDRLLAVLPLSFDYGFSQLSTAFHVGASVILMDYLLPRDVVVTAEREAATGLAGVPPLWIQLAELEWPNDVVQRLRYFTNSGGAMPAATLAKLRARLPRTRPFLMYGLTEAFRSTFLPPDQVELRPDSIGKAIPNAEILVLRPDGSPCEAEEPGELVHRGVHVSLGYWNDPIKTAERFKPIPAPVSGLVQPEIAVWSGDTVRRDAEGYLYFVGRQDEMIKSSGYRISPTEIEEALHSTGLVQDVVALGAPHPTLGHAIVVVASPPIAAAADSEALLAECRKRLPNYMQPALIEWREQLPRNANGKFDRAALAALYRNHFSESAET